MDYGKLTSKEITNGYRYDDENGSYICNYCEQQFEVGQIFPIDNCFYVAEVAVKKHIEASHGGNLAMLLASDSKYNALTQNQKELMALFGAGMSDKEMAKRLNVTETTIRRQRFTFSEKAKQAKFYLALHEQAFGDKVHAGSAIVPIHSNATYVDDRYLITEQERQRILDNFFSSLNPLVLKTFSPKEKNKVVILTKIAERFEKGMQYSEKEVNQILKPVYEDYVTLRRYLISYGFMQRMKDGSKYWLAT